MFGRTRSLSRESKQQQRRHNNPAPPPLHFDGSVGYSTDANLHAVSLTQIVAHARSVKQGWLHKKGRHFKNWKKRWFVLSPESLQYFTSPDMAKAKDEIPLETTTEVRSVFTA